MRHERTGSRMHSTELTQIATTKHSRISLTIILRFDRPAKRRNQLCLLHPWSEWMEPRYSRLTPALTVQVRCHWASKHNITLHRSITQFTVIKPSLYQQQWIRQNMANTRTPRYYSLSVHLTAVTLVLPIKVIMIENQLTWPSLLKTFLLTVNVRTRLLVIARAWFTLAAVSQLVRQLQLSADTTLE